MLALEVSITMKAATQKTEIERLDDGAWVSELLAEIKTEVAAQPSADAIERIRSRLLAQIREPFEAAA